MDTDKFDTFVIERKEIVAKVNMAKGGRPTIKVAFEAIAENLMRNPPHHDSLIEFTYGGLRYSITATPSGGNGEEG